MGAYRLGYLLILCSCVPRRFLVLQVLLRPLMSYRTIGRCSINAGEYHGMSRYQFRFVRHGRVRFLHVVPSAFLSLHARLISSAGVALVGRYGPMRSLVSGAGLFFHTRFPSAIVRGHLGGQYVLHASYGSLAQYGRGAGQCNHVQFFFVASLSQ